MPLQLDWNFFAMEIYSLSNTNIKTTLIAW